MRRIFERGIRILTLTSVAVLVFMVLASRPEDSMALTVTNLNTYLSNTIPTASGNVQYVFHTASALSASGCAAGGRCVKLEFDFPVTGTPAAPIFTLSSSLAFADVSVTTTPSIGGVNLVALETGRQSAASGADTINLYLESAYGNAIPAGTQMSVAFLNARVTNPAKTNAAGYADIYGLSLRTYASSTGFVTSTNAVDNGATHVALLEGVTFSADVTVTSGTPVTIRWATPELRSGAAETNDDSTFYLIVRNTSTHAAVFTMSSLATTTNAGVQQNPITLSVASGTYDVGIKTDQHLMSVLYGVALTPATTTVLNFTNDTNLTSKGSKRLHAGDVSGAGTTVATLGDDVVNSIDISVFLSHIDEDDPTGNVIRANLNQDIVVNSVDLSMMINHLDEQGER